MTDNGGERGSGAADSWFKPTENRYRTQSDYQDPLEEKNEDATVFPDSGGYAGLSSSRPPMVEPYPEALGGPPPAVPPSTHAISYPGASQAAFQPLTRVPGEFDENASQEAGERGFPGVAASAQVPLPPEESGPAGDEVWGRDSWAQAEARPQEPGSETAPPAADDTPWGAPEPSATTDFSWDAPEGAPTNPPSPGTDASAWAPGSDDGSAWAAPGAPLDDVAGTDAPWGATGAPAAGGSPWGAPDGARPNTDSLGPDAGGRSPVAADEALWGAPSAGDAPWGAPAPAETGADWNPSSEGRPGADAPWGAPAQDVVPGADAPWAGAESSGDAPVGADPSLDGPVASDTGAWSPERPAADAPWSPSAEADAPWGAASADGAPWGAPAQDVVPGADAPWGAPAPGEAGTDWNPNPTTDRPLDNGPGAEAPWGAPIGADPSLDGPVTPDTGGWNPGEPAGDAPWSPSAGGDAPWGAPASDGVPGAHAPWGAPVPAEAGADWNPSPDTGLGSESSWDAPVGADPSLDGPVVSDAGAWSPERPAADAPWSPSAEADAPWGAAASTETGTDAPWGAPAPDGVPGADAPWGAPVPAEAGADWNPSPDTGLGSESSWDAPVGADPSLDGPVAPEAGGWNQGRPADDAPWGAPDGASARTGAGPDEAEWSPGQPEHTQGWTPVPADDDAPWGAADTGPDASGPGAWSPREGGDGWSPAPATEDPLRGGGRDWDRDELGSSSWGDERRTDLRDEGTDGLETWAPAREGDDAWAPSADAEPRPGDRYADELSPEAPAPGPVASGNTWAFDRDDLRLPDVVREAEQRRREAAAGPEYQDWGGDPASPADPLAAIADLQARAPEPGTRGYDEPEDRYGEGATQMFDAPAYDAPDADAYDAPGYDRPGYDAPGYDGAGYDAPGYDGADYDEPAYDGPRDGGATQMFDAYAQDDQGGYDEPVAQGAPSDAGPRERGEESEYEDGFTPADYGMPAQPEQRRRRKDPIADDFPGFGDRPLGGEAGDAYPGYDSIEYLADTERGAMVTLWLGLASLVPGIGLITAVLALVVTGPKAKRAIRGSHGQLDGLGLITAGTVLAVVGILVSVASVLLFVLF